MKRNVIGPISTGLIIPPIVYDRIGIVARARESQADLAGSPQAVSLKRDEAVNYLVRSFGGGRWSRIEAVAENRIVAIFAKSRRGSLISILGVAGDWGVSIYQETSVDTMEAEALANRQLRLFPPDVRVIDRRP